MVHVTLVLYAVYQSSLEIKKILSLILLILILASALVSLQLSYVLPSSWVLEEYSGAKQIWN